MTSLHSVIKNGRYHQFSLLMRLGVDVNHANPEDGLLPLMQCCYVENERYAGWMTKVLLEYGAKKGLTDRYSRNSLVHAVLTNRVGVMKILLKVIDFDVNQTDNFGNTLLHHVAFVSDKDMAKLVMSRLPLSRTDVDKMNDEGFTPLMCACVNGNLEAAQILVNEGKASLTVRDNQCFRNALDWLRSAIFVPRLANPFSYGYKPIEGKPIELDSTNLKLNLPDSLLEKRPKTSTSSPRHSVSSSQMRLQPILIRRSTSAPPSKDRRGSRSSKGTITSPSVDDLSDMRSAESRIRLMREKSRYNNMQSLRQLYITYESQLCPSFRASAVPPVIMIEDYDDDQEADDSSSMRSSSQMSVGHSSQGSISRFKKTETVVETALALKKMGRRDRSSRTSSRASLGRSGKQSSTDSGSLSSSANSDRFKEKLRKTQNKVSARRAFSQPCMDGGEGGGLTLSPSALPVINPGK